MLSNILYFNFLSGFSIEDPLKHHISIQKIPVMHAIIKLIYSIILNDSMVLLLQFFLQCHLNTANFQCPQAQVSNFKTFNQEMAVVIQNVYTYLQTSEEVKALWCEQSQF